MFCFILSNYFSILEQKKICFRLEEENAKLRQEHQKYLQCEEEKAKLKKENQKLKHKVK